MSDIKTVFIIDGSNVLEVYPLGSNRFIPVCGRIIHHGPTFDNKFDALYAKLLKHLEKGNRLENYRSSKYYKQYIERLAIENPEYLI